MAGASHSEKLHVGKFEPSNLLQIIVIALAGLGTIGTAVGIYMNPERGWAGYLMAFFFFSCLALGGMFFTVINHIANAGWSVTVRRFAESLTAFLPMILIGGLILMLGAKHLYPWTNPDVLEKFPMVQAKTAYLNIPFMILRIVVFAVGVFLFARAIVGNSLKQDKDGSETHTKKNVGLSVGYTLFFAIFFSLFTVDLLMSLLPTWYSTIFGIYGFAGMFQSTMAFLVLLLLYVRRKGFISGYVTVEHIHDVAKYMKGFTIFWAYIAFSQFMLIWYANIPEETEFYLMRSQNGWTQLSLFLLIGRFVIPFLALLPRGWKRNPTHLAIVSVWILIMQFLDIYWLVFPNFNHNHIALGLYEILPMAGFAGIFLLMVGRFLRQNSMVPLKDPRLNEALNHHVTY